jgi:phosphopantetheinyl transferase
MRKEAIAKTRGVGLHADLRRQPTALRSPGTHGWRRTPNEWWLIEAEVGPVLICIASEHPQTVGIVVGCSMFYSCSVLSKSRLREHR